MKCLTLWQPWATLVAVGAKQFETRSWPCHHRGPLAIHASMTDPYGNYAIRTSIRRNFDLWADALKGQCRINTTKKQIDLDGLPRGHVVGITRMVDCLPAETLFEVTQLHNAGALRQMVGKLLYDSHSDRVIELANKGPLLSERERLFGQFSAGRFGFLLADAKKLEQPVPLKGKQGLFDVPDEVLGLDANKQ